MSTYPIALSGTTNTLMWADETTIEAPALDQLRNVANLPWTYGLRVMPDVHYGRGATVGSVIAMQQAIAPAAVGVDIGCGMTAVRTGLRPEQLPDDLHALRLSIERGVPLGMNSHTKEPRILSRDFELAKRYREVMKGFENLHARDLTKAARTGKAEKKAMFQLGALGSGNHFIELCSGDDGFVWITLHSGSRGTGNELAQVHMEIAQSLQHNRDLTDPDLAVFVEGSPTMAAYLDDLWWAQGYALLNRDMMLASVMDDLSRKIPGITFDEPIRCHHNYVARERYDDLDLLVTRKGAIRAGKGDLGVIPGSMGTGSYIVRGLGNVASFESASHGAGRRMSRGVARRTFTAEDLAAQTDGIECRKDSGVVDEIPAAYKNIDSVMADQADLVEVVARLQTLLCIKG